MCACWKRPRKSSNSSTQARERLTALCQSKPCIIDPEDCSIQEPQLSDFPDDPIHQRKGEIFIYWVRLCMIIGRIAKYLSRSTLVSPSPPFPTHLRQELVAWVQSLPPHLQLPIKSSRTQSFDRDVHQLHLPYLTTIIVLHLKRSSHDLPQALPPAMLAASCIARILRDILSRGNARYLMAITCWYCGTAFIALLQACRIDQLRQEAEEGLDALTHAVTQLQNMWATANIIRQGFDRLRSTCSPAAAAATVGVNSNTSLPSVAAPSIPVGDGAASGEDSDWAALFPFVTRSTNRIAECLLTEGEQRVAATTFPSPNNELFHENLLNHYQDLIEPFNGYNLDFSGLDFQP